MTERHRIFDRFNPHAMCEIIEYDASGPSLLVRLPEGGRERHAIQRGLRVQASTLLAGRTVGVQMGQIATGRGNGPMRRGITAMQHLVPRTDVLSLAVIRAYATDPDETIRQYVEGANTRVVRGGETGIDPCGGGSVDLEYTIAGGMMRASVRLGTGVVLTNGVITVEGVLPDTVIASMTGQRLASLIRHPVIIDPRIVIRGIEPAASTPENVTAMTVTVDSPAVDLAHHGEQTNLPFAA